LKNYFYNKFLLKIIKLLKTELNYTNFLRCSDNSSEKMVPFQDTSSDVFFHVGKIPIEQLRNYTTMKLEEHLGDVKNKPWLPLQHIKDELVNCIQLLFGSVSSNEFKYDKGLYGWMSMMKFSCVPLNENYILYGMAFTRARFRLKQVYLRRQNTYWTTSGRSIITRDVQKIAEVFAIRHSNFVMENAEDELYAMHSKKTKGNSSENGNNVFEAHYNHRILHALRSNSSKCTISVLGFSLLVSSVIINLSNELNDKACEMLDSCSNQTCSMTTNKVFTDRTDDTQALIFYQTSRPFFKFDSHKRKTLTESPSLIVQSDVIDQHLHPFCC
uniref:FERM domain-containing protein n=1 Tax=Haemonchus placei TaxID=6290 RepID=A0A0N4WXD9_HAEPC